MPTLLSGSTNSTGMFVQGRVHPTGRDRNQITINRVVIAPNFFETMGISLVAGRSVTEHDHAKAPKVAVINQAAARKFFPNENPIGRRFGTSAETSGDIEIVGVLRDVHYNSLRRAAATNDVCPIRAARTGRPDLQRADSRRPRRRLCRPYVAW